MIKPIRYVCKVCKEEINDLGATLLSPPVGGKVEKRYVCKECWSNKMTIYSKGVSDE